MPFLQRLLDLIEANGISRNKLLMDIGINKSAIFSWENRGTIPSGEIVAKLADYFHVSTDYLLGRTDDPRPVDEQKKPTPVSEGGPNVEVLHMRLKELRTSKKLLQKELAQMIGVDRTTYSKYESGLSEANYETLLKLADIFNVSIDYLLGRDERKEFTPVSVGGPNETARRFMPLVDELTPDQQRLLLAQLQAWTGQNGQLSPAAPDSDGEKAPEFEP